jgi:cell division protein FtsB
MTASRKILWCTCYVAVVLGLGVLSAMDPNGLRKHRRLDVEVRRVSSENRSLRLENVRLRREARALAGDPAALERAAREELNFVRPGEWVYKLDEPGVRP